MLEHERAASHQAAELADLRARLAAAEAALAIERRRADAYWSELGWWSPAITDRADIGILVGNLRGGFVRVNRAIQEMLGYSEAELLSMHFSLLTHPEDRAHSVALVREVIEGQRDAFHLEKRCLHKDGSVRWVSLNFSLIRDAEGQPIYSLGMVEDITERNRAFAALADSEERYRRLVELSQPLIMIHSEGVVVSINARGAAFLGAATPEQIVGQPVARFVHPDDGALVASRIKAARVDGVAHPAPVRLLTLDGQTLYVETTGLAITYMGKPAIHVIARDITAQKQMEESLKAQNEKLRELDDMKGQFMSAVSHELRTPLTSIKGFTEFLEDGIGGALSAMHREYVAQIATNTHRLEVLVDDLLDFVRLNAGTFKLKPKEADLCAVVREAVESLKPQALEAGLAMEVSLPDAPLLCRIDPTRVGQVLTNMLSNAIKFTPSGGSVSVRLGESDGGLRCAVTDTGIGIAAADQTRLFQRFVQLDASNTRHAGGTGLGLSISKAIIEGHGGAIGVESEPGRGSTFWFTLPR